jgi:glycosyltransferase involved in cell wall biosynthesis
MMRIGVVYLGRRGAGGAVSLAWAENLAQRADILAVVSEYSEGLAAWRASGVQTLITPTYRNALGAIRSFIKLSNIQRLADQIREWRPDVLLFPMFHTWNPLLQSQLSDIPAVVVVHDPQPHPGVITRIESLLENRSIQKAERYIVLSQSLVPALRARGAAPERIEIVPHGSLGHYQGYSSPDNVSGAAGERVLLFFGRVTRYKGLEVLLQAWRELGPTPPARLMIVGDGSLRPYEKLLDGLPKVEVVNRWIDDTEVGQYFEQAYAVVLPYTSASQSGVIATAAAYGLPVIATRTGGIPEQIESEHTGLLVDPGSTAQLVASMQRLLGDPVFARQLGMALLSDFKERRSWAVSADMVYRTCERAFAGSPAASR